MNVWNNPNLTIKKYEGKNVDKLLQMIFTYAIRSNLWEKEILLKQLYR